MADISALLVLVTAGSAEEASSIGDALVRGRLAACVSVVSRVSSVYRWRGEIERADETLLIIKTVASKLDDVTALVKSMHSYEVPEIIALPVVGGNPDYLGWLGGEVGQP